MEKNSGIVIEHLVQQIKAHLDGTLSPEEDEKFQLWLEASPHNRELLARIKGKRLLWEKFAFRKRNDLDKGWKVVQRRIHGNRVLLLQSMRYAAVVAVTALIGIAVYHVWHTTRVDIVPLSQESSLPARGGYKAYLELASGEQLSLDSASLLTANVNGAIIKVKDKGTVVLRERVMDNMMEEMEYNRIVVPRGGEYKVVLVDGSQIWINSFSDLEFPSCFMGKERRVKLKGEAYFEVKENVKMPFIVEVAGKEIRVLGTSFNVNSYGEKFVTTLVTGRVEVKVDNQTYVLNPAMQFRMEKENISLVQVDSRMFTAWKDGLFIFKKQPLQEVMDILSRWYDVEVFYQSPDLQDLHFTGTIQRHSDISEVLKFLEKTDIVKFTMNGKTLIVSE